MKKVIMSKVENTNFGSTPLQNNSVALCSPEPGPEEESAIHPPLPVDPPLSPLKSPKKEIIDDQETSEIVNETEKTVIASEQIIQTIKTEEPNLPQKAAICRDFIRGTCSRIGTCKFNHDRDLSQLQGVYTFCHNFQNKQCTYPKCRYVHATIPEQETFYRTGYLPPHTLAHHKPPAAADAPPAAEPPAAALPAGAAAPLSLPPPPPPPADPLSSTHTDSQCKSRISVKNPSTMLQSNVKPMVTTITSTNGTEQKADSEEHKALVKVNWFLDSENKENNCCENCDVKENRLQHAKDKFDELLENASAATRSTNHVDEKLKIVILLKKGPVSISVNQQQVDINSILQMLTLLNHLAIKDKGKILMDGVVKKV